MSTLCLGSSIREYIVTREKREREREIEREIDREREREIKRERKYLTESGVAE